VIADGSRGQNESPVRVLVVDDSATIRHLVCEILRAEDGIEVAGVAEHGLRGIERIEQRAPDVVVLDIEMPVMDGLATVGELRRRAFP
jgi:two-component system chemotaxis response regulator CheB